MELGVFLPDVNIFSLVVDVSIVFCRRGGCDVVDCELDEPVLPAK